MKYYLKIDTLDGDPSIALTYKEYEELDNAYEILVNAKAIEAKYDLLIINYLEFEKEVLNAGATNMIYRIHDYTKIFDIQQRLEARMINLLSSARLYIDQSKQNACKCFPQDTGIAKQVENLFSKEYEENKDFSFMEALRNYVQHRGLPIHLTQHGLRWTSLDDDGMIEFNFSLSSDKTRFTSDAKFKKSSLNGFADIIDLKSTTRGYVESLSRVHCSTREIINDSAVRARELIEAAHSRFPKFGNSLNNLYLLQTSDNGQTKKTPLLLVWDNVRLELVRKNRQLINLKKSYVTGVIKK